jgi:hypothetical protein
VRSLFIGLSLVLGTFAFAQEDWRIALNDAFGDVREHESIFMRLEGTTSTFGKESAILTDVFFRTVADGERDLLKLEIRNFVNGTDRVRTVADGVALWQYDFLRNEYRTSRYGSYQGANPENYRLRLFQSLASQAKGPNQTIIQLLKDIYGREDAGFRDLMGNTRATYLIDGSPATPDPVRPDWIYTPGINDRYVMLYATGKLDKSFVFHLSRGDEDSPFVLKSIFGNEQDNVSRTTRTTESSWRIDLYTTTIPSDANFKFIAPAGAKPIVSAGLTN